jgi:hypothetical protein
MKPFRSLIETLNGRRRHNQAQAMVEYEAVLGRRLDRPLYASDQQLPRVGVLTAGTGSPLPWPTHRRGKAARANKVPAGALRPVK